MIVIETGSKMIKVLRALGYYEIANRPMVSEWFAKQNIDYVSVVNSNSYHLTFMTPKAETLFRLKVGEHL